MTKYQSIPQDIFHVDVEIITEERVVVMTNRGEITGYEGSFIVTHANGAISVLKPNAFHEIYELSPEE